jgi:SAM-dependent methyltransferase
MMLDKLNLGCGAFKLPGYVNVDHLPIFNPDVVLDLNDYAAYQKLPQNHFREIRCEHVMEHLDKPFRVMQELHRLLRPGGKLIIKVPHFSRGFTHAEHAHGFDVSFPLYFNPNWKPGYLGFPLTLRRMTLRWMIRFDLKKGIIPWWSTLPLKIINSVLSFAANLNPFFCSRFWCYLVGGFEEIEYVFVKK